MNRLFGPDVDALWNSNKKRRGNRKHFIKAKNRNKHVYSLGKRVPSTLVNQLNKAQDLYVRGEYEESKQLLINCIEEYPRLSMPYYTLGLINEEEMNYETALHFYVLAGSYSTSISHLWEKVIKISKLLLKYNDCLLAISNLIKINGEPDTHFPMKCLQLQCYIKTGSINRGRYLLKSLSVDVHAKVLDALKNCVIAKNVENSLFVSVFNQISYYFHLAEACYGIGFGILESNVPINYPGNTASQSESQAGNPLSNSNFYNYCNISMHYYVLYIYCVSIVSHYMHHGDLDGCVMRLNQCMSGIPIVNHTVGLESREETEESRNLAMKLNYLATLGLSECVLAHMDRYEAIPMVYAWMHTIQTEIMKPTECVEEMEEIEDDVVSDGMENSHVALDTALQDAIRNSYTGAYRVHKHLYERIELVVNPSVPLARRDADSADGAGERGGQNIDVNMSSTNEVENGRASSQRMDPHAARISDILSVPYDGLVDMNCVCEVVAESVMVMQQSVSEDIPVPVPPLEFVCAYGLNRIRILAHYRALYARVDGLSTGMVVGPGKDWPPELEKYRQATMNYIYKTLFPLLFGVRADQMSLLERLQFEVDSDLGSCGTDHLNSVNVDIQAEAMDHGRENVPLTPSNKSTDEAEIVVINPASIPIMPSSSTVEEVQTEYPDEPEGDPDQLYDLATHGHNADFIPSAPPNTVQAILGEFYFPPLGSEMGFETVSGSNPEMKAWQRKSKSHRIHSVLHQIIQLGVEFLLCNQTVQGVKILSKVSSYLQVDDVNVGSASASESVSLPSALSVKHRSLVEQWLKEHLLVSHKGFLMKELGLGFELAQSQCSATSISVLLSTPNENKKPSESSSHQWLYAINAIELYRTTMHILLDMKPDTGVVRETSYDNQDVDMSSLYFQCLSRFVYLKQMMSQASTGGDGTMDGLLSNSSSKTMRNTDSSPMRCETRRIIPVLGSSGFDIIFNSTIACGVSMLDSFLDYDKAARREVKELEEEESLEEGLSATERSEGVEQPNAETLLRKALLSKYRHWFSNFENCNGDSYRLEIDKNAEVECGNALADGCTALTNGSPYAHYFVVMCLLQASQHSLEKSNCEYLPPPCSKSVSQLESVKHLIQYCAVMYPLMCAWMEEAGFQSIWSANPAESDTNNQTSTEPTCDSDLSMAQETEIKGVVADEVSAVESQPEAKTDAIDDFEAYAASFANVGGLFGIPLNQQTIPNTSSNQNSDVTPESQSVTGGASLNSSLTRTNSPVVHTYYPLKMTRFHCSYDYDGINAVQRRSRNYHSHLPCSYLNYMSPISLHGFKGKSVLYRSGMLNQSGIEVDSALREINSNPHPGTNSNPSSILPKTNTVPKQISLLHQYGVYESHWKAVVCAFGNYMTENIDMTDPILQWLSLFPLMYPYIRVLCDTLVLQEITGDVHSDHISSTFLSNNLISVSVCLDRLINYLAPRREEVNTESDPSNVSAMDIELLYTKQLHSMQKTIMEFIDYMGLKHPMNMPAGNTNSLSVQISGMITPVVGRFRHVRTYYSNYDQNIRVIFCMSAKKPAQNGNLSGRLALNSNASSRGFGIEKYSGIGVWDWDEDSSEDDLNANLENELDATKLILYHLKLGFQYLCGRSNDMDFDSKSTTNTNLMVTSNGITSKANALIHSEHSISSLIYCIYKDMLWSQGDIGVEESDVAHDTLALDTNSKQNNSLISWAWLCLSALHLKLLNTSTYTNSSLLSNYNPNSTSISGNGGSTRSDTDISIANRNIPLICNVIGCYIAYKNHRKQLMMKQTGTSSYHNEIVVTIECLYNLGMLYEHLACKGYAEICYKRILKYSDQLKLQKMENSDFRLQPDGVIAVCAHNLVCIYKNSGNDKLAIQIMLDYLVYK